MCKPCGVASASGASTISDCALSRNVGPRPELSNLRVAAKAAAKRNPYSLIVRVGAPTSGREDPKSWARSHTRLRIRCEIAVGAISKYVLPNTELAVATTKRAQRLDGA